VEREIVLIWSFHDDGPHYVTYSVFEHGKQVGDRSFCDMEVYPDRLTEDYYECLLSPSGRFAIVKRIRGDAMNQGSIGTGLENVIIVHDFKTSKSYPRDDGDNLNVDLREVLYQQFLRDRASEA
jgi:hypothetical protein